MGPTARANPIPRSTTNSSGTAVDTRNSESVFRFVVEQQSEIAADGGESFSRGKMFHADDSRLRLDQDGFSPIAERGRQKNLEFKRGTHRRATSREDEGSRDADIAGNALRHQSPVERTFPSEYRIGGEAMPDSASELH
jgi:hypothetical protein